MKAVTIAHTRYYHLPKISVRIPLPLENKKYHIEDDALNFLRKWLKKAEYLLQGGINNSIIKMPLVFKFKRYN